MFAGFARKVLAPGGMPAAESVLSLNCGGASYVVGFSDRKGRFNVAVNRRYSLQSMAEAKLRARLDTFYGDFINPALSGCRLEAMHRGYGKARLQLGLLRSSGPNDLGSLELDPLAGMADHTASSGTLTAPLKALKTCRSGLHEIRKQRPRYMRAVSRFKKAVKTHPGFAGAWAGLGEAFIALGGSRKRRDRSRRRPRRIRRASPRTKR